MTVAQKPTSIRVLCVEDASHDLALIRHALERETEGFEVTGISDQQAFREQLAENEFDVVLTDFHILGFEGLEVIREVKKLQPKVPVIVVTGTGSEEVAVRSLKEGAEDYVIKTPRHIAQLPHTIHQVLETRRSRERLAESQANIRTIVENTADGLLVVGDRGRILFSNPAAEALLGAGSDELIGTDFGHPVSTSTSPEIDLPNRRLGAGVAELRAAPATWNGVPCKIVTLRDITDRKRAESALRDSEDMLRQSQKMEAVGQLAGGIAHDFNNLLTAILGYNDLVIASLSGTESSVLNDALEVKKAAERAATLTRQILAFSRRQVLNPTLVSLNSIVTGMDSLLRRTLGEQVDLVTALHPHLGLVEVDVHQFEQVLINLAINARDAMPAGGRLRLETDNVELNGASGDAPPDLAPGSYVLLSVSDTGVGMDQATQTHMFEPFFTTKPPGAGTGLGLSTVHGIVKQSRGGLAVDSAPGDGTTVKVFLPRAAPKG